MKEFLNKHSVLVAGVPRDRGTPRHIEHDDDKAFTVIFGNQVQEIHTPQEIFARVHELMHAQHSSETHMAKMYKRVHWLVMQLTEDVRIHTFHWPWDNYSTPDLIGKAVNDFMSSEKRKMRKWAKDDPKFNGSFVEFAVKLRQVAIYRGMGDYKGYRGVKFSSRKLQDFAYEILGMIHQKAEKQAAETIHKAFFGPLIEIPEGPISDRELEHDKPGYEIDEVEDDPVIAMPEMSIIELAHTERIPEAKIGYRVTTTGPRLHRPSIRKPILPQRLFVRKQPVKPAGTILIDASGSMGSWDRVREWVKASPFATVAYYAGGRDNTGQLFVYARNGKRSPTITAPDGGNNTVDGPAIDWLLTQKAPRIMVTDRGFCGAPDSHAQVIRLEHLERRGLIEVRNYKGKKI
jgi:hypothetical protein